jgi:PilZ domain
MSDRRREERWIVCLDAVWDGKSGNYSARITDLSEGGCYVDTLGGASVGEILSFRLQLPRGEWLELSGEVAHQTPPLGFGLRFVNLTDNQTEKLRALITHLEDPQDPAAAILRL